MAHRLVQRTASLRPALRLSITGRPPTRRLVAVAVFLLALVIASTFGSMPAHP
jgi:hypothetical protein